jgi:Ca2+-transporting ATPase
VLYREKNERILYVCGAPEKILEFCTLKDDPAFIKTKEGKEEKAKLNEKINELAAKGLRMVACAYKQLTTDSLQSTILADEINDLIFVGLITLQDPIRQDVKEAMKACRKAGMKPIIVTGDHKLTAKAVAEELGLKITEENILEGKNLDKLSEEEFEKILDKIQIYARVEPKHKMRIVSAWQKKGEVVAMTGDGINDAPALKKADIGVALGSGTEVAKETADLILLNDSFSIIVAAVEEGRAVLDNIRKVITYLVSDSFCEVILIGGSMVISWFTHQTWILPVTAVQILWTNLIEDGLPNIALAFEPKEKDLMERQPEAHKTPLLTKEMKTLILIAGLVDDVLLLGLFFWLLKFSGYPILHIQSIMFANLATDTLYFAFCCKSLRRNLWHINPFSNKLLNISLLVSVVLLLGALYFPPLQILLKTEPLYLFDWGLVLGLTLIDIIVIEATKWHFISRHEV